MVDATWPVQATLPRHAEARQESAFSLCVQIYLSASHPHSAFVSLKRTTPPAAPVGWASVGCYTYVSTRLDPNAPVGLIFVLRDISSNRTLRTAAFTDLNDMTIESCTAFCTPAGYQYAGVEFGRVRIDLI